MTDAELNAIEASHPDPLGDRHNVYRLLNEVRRLRAAIAPLAEIDTSGVEWCGGECMVLVTAEDVERARAALRGGK